MESASRRMSSRLKIHQEESKIADDVKVTQESSSTVKRNASGTLEHGAIRKVLLPLIVSMRILGLYFEKADKQRITKQYSRVYCILVLVIMWLDAIRVFTIFIEGDTLQSVLGKVNNVIWIVMSAVIQTSCYRASHKGRILEVLQTFSKDMTPRWAKELRVKVVSTLVIAWLYTAFSVALSAYVSFSDYTFRNIRLAPINTLIINPNRLTIDIFSGLYLVLEIYVTGAIITSIVWIYVLSSIMSHEFNKCAKMLLDIVKDPEVAKKNLERIRRHHQSLCRMADEIDGQICVGNGTHVVGLIGVAILCLYSLVAYPDVRRVPFYLFTAVFWMLSSALGLIMVATGGIMINQSAHQIYEILHDIDLTNLNSETIGQINTFLNRVCGEPIGFTVLRIFVIDRNTILTILGLLITYFLIIIDVSPPSPNNQWDFLRSQFIVSTNEPTHSSVASNSTARFF